MFRYATEWVRKPSDNELKLRKAVKKMLRENPTMKKEEHDDLELSKDSRSEDQIQASSQAQAHPPNDDSEAKPL